MRKAGGEIKDRKQKAEGGKALALSCIFCLLPFKKYPSLGVKRLPTPTGLRSIRVRKLESAANQSIAVV